MKVLIFAIAFVSAFLAYWVDGQATSGLAFTNPPTTVQIGKPVTLTWTGEKSAVNIALYYANGFRPANYVVENFVGQSYTWTPQANLNIGTDYSIQIADKSGQIGWLRPLTVLAAGDGGSASQTSTSSAASSSSTPTQSSSTTTTSRASDSSSSTAPSSTTSRSSSSPSTSSSASSASSGSLATTVTNAGPQTTPLSSSSTTPSGSSPSFSSTGSAGAGGLSSATKVGIGVGVGLGVPLLLLFVAVIGFLVARDRRKRKQTATVTAIGPFSGDIQKWELGGNPLPPKQYQHVPPQGVEMEQPAYQRAELAGQSNGFRGHELGPGVPRTELKA